MWSYQAHTTQENRVDKATGPETHKYRLCHTSSKNYAFLLDHAHHFVYHTAL